MSGWISAGLRVLTEYFGDEEDAAVAVAVAASTTTAPHKEDEDDWNSGENRSRGNKRKADSEAHPAGDAPEGKSSTRLSAARVKRRGGLEHGRSPGDKAESIVGPAAASDATTKELDPSFQRRLDELENFKAEHGHTNVTYEASRGCGKRMALYAWVGFQRARRKALPGRYRTKRIMSQAEIHALDAIGFEWEIPERDYTSVTRPDTFWTTLELVKEYKKKHGHTNVPFDPSRRDTVLYNFVHRQRARWKALPNSYLGGRVMVQAEIDALDAIGFEWIPPLVERTPQNSFWERVEELKEFKQSNGHLNIRCNKGSSTNEIRLYSWTTIQRKRYKALPKRHRHYLLMTPDEIAALDSVGFEWERPVVQREYKSYFWERLEELTAYKAKHGHIRIRASDQDQRSLYDFCSVQRLRYKAFPKRHGPKTAMTQDEKDALDAIGFEVWTQP